MKVVKLSNVSDFCNSINFAKQSDERYILLTNDTPCMLVCSDLYSYLKKNVNTNF